MKDRKRRLEGVNGSLKFLLKYSAAVPKLTAKHLIDQEANKQQERLFRPSHQTCLVCLPDMSEKLIEN